MRFAFQFGFAAGRRLVGPPAPTIESASIAADGLTLTVVFSEAVTIGAGGSGGISVKGAAPANGSVDATYDSGDTTDTFVFTLDSEIYTDEQVTLDYVPATNGLENGDGTDITGTNDLPVTNNSAVGDGILTDSETGLPLSDENGRAIPYYLFDASSIADLDAWYYADSGIYDATSGGAAVADAGGVKRWEDLSGNGAHLTEGTNPPIFDEDGTPIGGGCLTFDGVAQKIGRTGGAVFDQPCTVFVVLRQDSFTSGEYILDTRGAGVRPMLLQSVSGQLPRGRGNLPTGTPAIANGTWGVITMVDTATAISIQLNDGTPVSSATAATTAGAFNLSLGCNNLPAPSTFAHCSIAEFIAYGRALDTSEQAQVVEWLMARHGIS